MKNLLKSQKAEKKKEESSVLVTEKDPGEGKSLDKVKKNMKINLSIYLNNKNKRKIISEKWEQKEQENKILQERRKSEVLRKREEGWKKRKMVQKRIEDLLTEQREKSQIWDLKLSRRNSRLLNYTPKVKKTSDLSPLSDFRNHSAIDLEDLYSKQVKSGNIHSNFLRNKSEKSAIHNKQVKKVYENHLNLCDNKEKKNLLKAINKSKGIIKCKVNREKLLNASVSRKGIILENKGSKLKEILQTQDDQLTKKQEKIQNRAEKTKFYLMSHLAVNNEMRKIKSLRSLLKTEDTQENLKRIKKESEKKKLKLLEKHLKNIQKLQNIKENKEKLNLKARVEASLVSQEHEKGKNLMLIINQSEDPEKVAKFINRHY